MPAARSAMVYVLDPERSGGAAARAWSRISRRADGIDVRGLVDGEEAAVWSERGELRFAPGGDLDRLRGGRWSVDGERGALGLVDEDGRVRQRARTRTRSAGCGRRCSVRARGDLLVSAAAGYEFVDWGGADHVGGGSHGSLHRGDSLGALVMCGLDEPPEREQWAIRDVTPRWCSTTSRYPREVQERRRHGLRLSALRSACTRASATVCASRTTGCSS